MIGILDMEMGNLRSVENAVYQMGFDPQVVKSANQLGDVSHLIIPGVGQFSSAMRHVREMGLYEPVTQFAGAGRPVLGICLGMQVLATTGYEGGETSGFDLIKGQVKKIVGGNGLRIPHVGWNRAILKRRHPILEGLKPDRDFYFVHSYAFRPANDAEILAETDYGDTFASMVASKSVVGLQFHPEKSQVNGLRLIENFCNWDGVC